MLIHPETISDTLKKDGEFLEKISKFLNITTIYYNKDGEQGGPDGFIPNTKVPYYVELKRRVNSSVISDDVKGIKSFPFKTLQFPSSNLDEAIRENRVENTLFIQYDDAMDGYFEVDGRTLNAYGKRSQYRDKKTGCIINSIEIDTCFLCKGCFI